LNFGYKLLLGLSRDLRRRNHDVLTFVVLCGTLSLVLGLLDGSFFVALLEVVDDVFVQLLDALLQL
jgi:hypothetical protein